MSRLQVVNQGEEAILDTYFAVAAIGGGHSLRLFTNDVQAGLTETQLNALDETDFTEATFTGYAAVTINSGWTTTQGDPSVAVNTQRTFTRSSTGTAQLIRGYYLTLVADGKLQWYEQFDGPVSIEFLGDALRITPQLTMDDEGSGMPTGSITMHGGASAPTGWLLCNGAAVSRATFAALFAEIGTAFGVGDGSTTFNLPDLRQRFPLGKAASGTGATLGSTGGAIDHVHGLDSATSAALIRAADSTGTIRSRLKTVPSFTPTDSRNLGTSIANASVTQATELTGDSDTENPPFQAVNFIVKT